MAIDYDAHLDKTYGPEPDEFTPEEPEVWYYCGDDTMCDGHALSSGRCEEPEQ